MRKTTGQRCSLESKSPLPGIQSGERWSGGHAGALGHGGPSSTGRSGAGPAWVLAGKGTLKATARPRAGGPKRAELQEVKSLAHIIL